MRKSAATTLSRCTRLAVTLLRHRPNTACKPDFDANPPHENLATAPPQRGTQVPPRRASPTTPPPRPAKTPPPQHRTQVPPRQPVAQEPRRDATRHSTTQKPHHQPAATPLCTSPALLTSYSSTS